MVYTTHKAMVMTTGDGKNGIGFTHMIGDIMEISWKHHGNTMR
jgi:fumarylacetoacetate (FAA) hydrolase family protein